MNYRPEPRYYGIGHKPIIGKGCVLVNTLFDGFAQITIGDHVFFGHDCKVLTGGHDYNKKKEERKTTARHKPITIEDGVWIASGCIIIGGVTIGENAVIGAGSVVTKDVPANELWAGNPAKRIKKIWE